MVSFGLLTESLIVSCFPIQNKNCVCDVRLVQLHLPSYIVRNKISTPVADSIN